MEKMEKIECGGEIVAIVVRKAKNIDGIHFFSPPEFSQQLGLMARPKGYNIKRHIHRIVPRNVSVTQEVLHVLYGRVEIALYDKQKKEIKTLQLSSGDTILLASGGHGITFIEDSQLLEVKQGPYSGSGGDKEHF